MSLPNLKFRGFPSPLTSDFDWPHHFEPPHLRSDQDWLEYVLWAVWYARDGQQPMTDPLEPQSPRPSSPQGSSISKEDRATYLYTQGVRAFKRGQYGEALDWFQQLAQVEAANPALTIKGQMGLIRTHQKLGQIDQARQGCQRIIARGIPEACRWAEGVLAQLPALPQPAPAQSANAVPLEQAQSADPLDQASPSALSADPTGFVPLDDSPPPAFGRTPQGLKAQIRHPPRQPVPQPEAPNESAVPETPETEESLFLYWQLNQDEDNLSPAKVDPPPRPVPPVVSPAAAPSSQQRPPRAAHKTTGSGQRQPPWRPPYELWGVQLAVICLTLWVVITGFHGLLRGINAVVRQGGRLFDRGGLALLERTYTGPILLLFVGLVLTSPWWMDFLLARFHGQRPLTSRQLQGQHLAALQLLRQQCQRQGWYLPELRLLPDAVPLCFSYGWRPRHLRIVVSQGLLDQCDSDMLGIFYLYELAHMMNRATAVVSSLGGLLVIIQAIHRRLATAHQHQSAPVLRGGLGTMTYLCYGLFWALRRGLLWISRLRSDWADRRVDHWLQRPDRQRESLRWITAQLPASVDQRGTLPPLWWSLDLLMPVSPQAALSPGSWATHLGEATTVLADWANPYRHWLVGGATHTPLGERLHWLNQRALQRQQTALNLAEPITAPPSPLSMPRLMLQKSPVLGLCVGGGLALGFWFVGGLVLRFGWQRLSWWYQDESLLYGGLLLGLGLGLLLRINTLYPDIPQQQPISDPSLLLGPLDQIPVEGYPCRLAGTLLRPNDLPPGTDCYLKTLGGLVKLHFSSPQPLLWNLWRKSSPLDQWVGRSVTVSGWRRRSDGILWIDVASLELASRRQAVLITAPIWATAISLGLCLGGIAMIWTGASIP